MKNLLMTLLFLSGLAATQLDAQSCCTPCPPECCVKACPTGASNLKACTPQAAATCTPEQLKACLKGASTGSATQAKTSAVTTAHEGTAPTGEPIGQPLAKQVALKEEQ